MPLFDITTKEMRLTPLPDVSIVCLLYSIEYLSNNEVVFSFDDEAVEVFEASGGEDSCRRLQTETWRT
jgi:hypothetical protein